MLNIDATETHDFLTLREVAERNLLIAFKCDTCGARQDLDLQQLIVKHGAETRVVYIRRHTHCERCLDKD